VVGLVIVMYQGFLASNLVLGGEGLASLGAGPLLGIALVGVLSVIATIYGYDFIHTFARAMSWGAGVVLVLAALWIVCVHGLPTNFLHRNGLKMPGLLSTISVAALWQIAYAPYVSDYTRYLPPGIGTRTAFWSSYWGCALGSLLAMALGALVGAAAPPGNSIAALATLTDGFAPLIIVILILGVAAANAMSLYCGTLSVLTFGQTLFPAWSPHSRARTLTTLILFALSLVLSLLGKNAFLTNYTNFILLLLYVLVPWTAINLTDYYLVRHGHYDVNSFLRRDGGIYGRFNTVAVGCYLLGILVQFPFMATPLYTGFVARALGGADISWVVGLAITAPVYYGLTLRTRRAGANASDARSV